MTSPLWTDLSLSTEMLSLIESAGYKVPSPVQAQSIPLVITGSDVLVSSQTGSGKTASFVIPTVERFKGKNGTYVLALAPTREIAQQTGAVFETFGAPFGLKTVVCIGGASLQVEKDALSSSPHIIVATPGRLCDHLERGNVWLDFIQCLIFDEADRMLDMGFAKQIDIITEQIPKERQTLMFSATFTPVVEKLARSVLKNPQQVSIAKAEGSTPKIEEHLYWMNDDEKIWALKKLTKSEEGTIIVFSNSKERVYRIWRALHSKTFDDVTYLHSDCTQEHREGAIADFKSGKYRVLIATDVMGRGIDVDDVAHVVNFDIPREAEDYIHRIGRTGRRGKTGVATSFAIPGKDDRSIKAIGKLLGKESTPLPPEKEDRSQRPTKEREQRRPKSDNPQRPRSEKPRHQEPRVQARGEKPAGAPKHGPTHTAPKAQAHAQAHSQSNAQTHTQSQAKSQMKVPPQALENKTGGFIGWIKKLLGK